MLAQLAQSLPAEAAHRAGFLETNKALRLSKVDDSLSGTTAVTAWLSGARLLVANVGDSRAVLAEDNGRTVTAFNLSCDQTPFRRASPSHPPFHHLTPVTGGTSARACAARARA